MIGIPALCSEFVALDGSALFWNFVEEVHSSLSMHRLPSDTSLQSIEADASEWAADIVEQMVSPDQFKVTWLVGVTPGVCDRAVHLFCVHTQLFKTMIESRAFTPTVQALHQARQCVGMFILVVLR